MDTMSTMAPGTDAGMPSDTTAMGGGMMTMRPVERIDVPAGETVALEPGGYHVMLLDLAAPLEVGATVEVTLTFESAGTQVVTADVRDA
jgi:copper(I)-binding protein